MYLYWRTTSNGGGFMGAKLNAECTALEDEGGAVKLADIQHEAPAVFQWGGRTYIWTSATTGQHPYKTTTPPVFIHIKDPGGVAHSP